VVVADPGAVVPELVEIEVAADREPRNNQGWPNDHLVTIDLDELQRYDLRQPQAGGISQAQQRFVLDASSMREVDRPLPG
jgi:hypothetical protein